VSASPDSEAVLGDVWFAREGDEERELRAASCEARRCQLLDLGFYYRRCALVSAANDSVEVGDEVRYFFSTRGPDINQSGRSANYQCQLDGSWIQTDDSVGGGSNCPDCAHELIDRWYINDVIVQENICTDACYVDDAPNYNYQELVGFGSLQPAGSSYTRCVYEAGVLVSADIAACSTESDNEWTSYGEDSSCPETVEDLNALATVYTNVTPCSTDNCVAWRSSWGWWTKTAEIPD
jgi:hypothetical protein